MIDNSFSFFFRCWNKNQRKHIQWMQFSRFYQETIDFLFPRDPRKYSFWCKNNYFSFVRFALMQSNICIYFTRNRRAWLYDGEDDDESLVIVVLSLSFYSFFARTSFYRLNHPILSKEQVSIANSIELFIIIIVIIIRFFLFFFLILFFLSLSRSRSCVHISIRPCSHQWLLQTCPSHWQNGKQ